MALEGNHTGGVDQMAKVLHGLLTKNALGGVDDQAVVSEETKDSTEVLEVGGTGRRGNEDIIEVNKTVREVAKNTIHEMLQGLCRVAETKSHPRNSNRLKGVMMAVLGMCLGSMGTWRYPLVRSSLLKIVQLWRFAEKSWILGRG